MRWFIICVVALAGPAHSVEADEGRILKVLPHFIDQQGLHTLSPSLYERDAYQAILRHNPERRGGLRFDIHWRARRVAGTDLKLRVELRGIHENEITTHVLELPVERRRWFATWSDLIFSGPEYEAFGELNAWRVTLWEGEQQLAEERSFLWPTIRNDSGQALPRSHFHFTDSWPDRVNRGPSKRRSGGRAC